MRSGIYQGREEMDWNMSLWTSESCSYIYCYIQLYLTAHLSSTDIFPMHEERAPQHILQSRCSHYGTYSEDVAYVALIIYTVCLMTCLWEGKSASSISHFMNMSTQCPRNLFLQILVIEFISCFQQMLYITKVKVNIVAKVILAVYRLLLCFIAFMDSTLYRSLVF